MLLPFKINLSYSPYVDKGILNNLNIGRSSNTREFGRRLYRPLL